MSAAARTLPPEAGARWFSPRVLATIGLLIAGVFFAHHQAGRFWFDPRHVLILEITGVALVGVVAVRPIRGRAIGFMNVLRSPSTGGRRTLAVVLAVGSGFYLYAEAAGEGRRFRPVIHDEYCYLIQARMLASGHLWMPRHELAGHFDTFHMVSEPAYAAKYGPGSALLLAPAIAAGLPYWIVPLALTALAVGLAYLVVTHWVDGLAGLMAAVMLPSLRALRRVSVEPLSQPVMMVLALVALWAFIHWRRRRSLGWFAVMSAAVGWGAATRPADAAALGLALGVGILIELRKAPAKQWAATVLVGLVSVAPFVALQAVYNKGVTGSWARMPWTHYGQRNDPYDRLLVGRPSTAEVSPDLPVQKRQFSQELSRAAYEHEAATPLWARFWRERLAETLAVDVPHALLIVLLPLGIVGAMARGRWPVFAFVAAFLLVYAIYTFYVAHYALVIAVPVLLLVLAGWDALAAGVPRAAGDCVRLVSAMLVLALAVLSTPQLERVRMNDEWQMAGTAREVDDRLAAVAGRPAVVLFRFDPATSNTHVEPVYNSDVAWPDDARVIRAHDLGDAANARLFAYYAAREPGRRVYRYDRAKSATANPLRYLGTAGELARNSAGSDVR